MLIIDCNIFFAFMLYLYHTACKWGWIENLDSVIVEKFCVLSSLFLQGRLETYNQNGLILYIKKKIGKVPEGVYVKSNCQTKKQR